MISVLRPVYRSTDPVRQVGVEAVGPVEVYRPVPPWVGPAALAAGGALLVLALATRRRSHRKPPQQ